MDLKGRTVIVTGGASGIGRATAAKAGVAGPTDTPLFQRQPERIKEALTRAIPFRRIARPAEIAEAVLFFASGRSDYITG
jgi:NAD(P)-dependent dehydrogenase (short-subunit alcohol dehydrogenase family)